MMLLNKKNNNDQKKLMEPNIYIYLYQIQNKSDMYVMDIGCCLRKSKKMYRSDTKHHLNESGADDSTEVFDNK